MFNFGGIRPTTHRRPLRPRSAHSPAHSPAHSALGHLLRNGIFLPRPLPRQRGLAKVLLELSEAGDALREAVDGLVVGETGMQCGYFSVTQPLLESLSTEGNTFPILERLCLGLHG